MMTVMVIHFMHKVSLYFSTPAVNRRLVEWWQAYIHQQKVISIKEKVKVIKKWGGEEKKLMLSGFWYRKFYDPNNLDKQNQNYIYLIYSLAQP